jgi:hypothetical protein
MRRVETPDAGDRNLVEDAIAYFQTADELYRRGEYRFGMKGQRKMADGRALKMADGR